MIVSFDLRSYSPMCSAFSPSILICPSEASIIRNNANVMDDFPAPVLPTMPTWKAMEYHAVLQNKYSASMIILFITLLDKPFSVLHWLTCTE